MKRIRMIFFVTLIALTLICLCACNEDKGGDNTTPSVYTIQYVDDGGTHTITVSTGELYSLDSIPSKNGYEFLGLFDADQGGTQYVHANGSAISAFTDNKNLVLYPQFTAKEYTLVLNYGEAAVTGSRQIKASYGQTISELPTNLTVENKNFVGWYTQENKKGTQVADQYGLIPQNSILTEEVFDLSDSRGFVYLYAGFTGEMHTVTFYYGNDPTPEEMQIEHGTYISEVVTSKRVDGKAAISWTKASGSDEVYTGKIDGNMVLYAYEYAPVIEFNSNGGNKINSIVAKSGDSISLPTPTRENYKFAGWYTAGGTKYTSTVMGSDSVSLTARWNPIIIFNTNGGTAVDDISAEVGSRVTLPTTSKDGFMFAGWYTEQGQEYTATNMPQNSVKLVAKWHKVISTSISIVPKDNETCANNYYSKYRAPSLNWYREISLEDNIPIDVTNINIKGYVELKYVGASAAAPRKICIDFYNKGTISDYNLLSRHNFNVSAGIYNRFTFNSSWINVDRTIIACFYLPDYYNNSAYIRDLYIVVEYPDMSKLY